jgi:hypothetical protein
VGHVGVEDGLDARPKRRDEPFPRGLQLAGEEVAGGCGIGEHLVERASRLARQRLAASPQVLGYLLGRCRPDLLQLVPESGGRPMRRRGQEVWDGSAQRVDREQRCEAEAGGFPGHRGVPGLVVGASARVDEHPDGEEGLPGR